MTNSPQYGDNLSHFVSEVNSAIPNVVYHYADTAALLSIIEHKNLRATSIRYMNDPLEFSYAADSAVKFLEKSLSKEMKSREFAKFIDCWPRRGPSKFSAVEYMLIRIIDALRGEKYGYFPGDLVDRMYPLAIFNTSFCEDGDLLSQWRGYAGTDGWALGFDLKEIIKHDGSVHPMPIKYGDGSRDEGIKASVEQIAEGFRQTYRKDYSQDAWKSYDQDPYHAKEIHEELLRGEDIGSILTYLIRELSGYKHSAFAEEKEWRIVFDKSDSIKKELEVDSHKQKAISETSEPASIEEIVGTSTKSFERDFRPVKFRPGAVALTPYIEIPFPESALREVFIGPHPRQDLQQASLEWFLRQDPGFRHVKVRRSEAPFR